MRGVFEEVEGGLLALQDLDEELSLQEQTLDLRMRLALAREKHNHRLYSVKSEYCSLTIFACTEYAITWVHFTSWLLSLLHVGGL